MELTTEQHWREEFVLASEAARTGAAAHLYRAYRRGGLVRLAPGVFLSAPRWETLGPEERHVARLHAVALVTGPGIVFSHRSAAALWALPFVGEWPERAEVAAPHATGGRSRRHVAVRAYGMPERCESIDGLPVTTLARTVVDVARVVPFPAAVAVADRALASKTGVASDPACARVDRADLDRELAAQCGSRGRARAADVVRFADGRAGSPGESISRAGMHALGMPVPELQREFHDRHGLIGVVDFWWPEAGVVGEFDGRVKYEREDLRGGRTPGEVVVAEKRREDRLRALGLRVVRWDWRTATSLPLLEAALAGAGVRAPRRPIPAFLT